MSVMAVSVLSLAQETPSLGITRDMVGAENLPSAIAPIEAPFDMPQLQRPVFPKRKSVVRLKAGMDCKAVTSAIQSAIESMNKRGGGQVIVPAGEWTTGRIILLSNVDLHLSEGCVLHFSPSLEDYLPAVFTRSAGVEGMGPGSCIYAYKQHNIALTGKGKMVGPENGCEMRQLQIGYGSFDSYVEYDKPATERFYDGRDGGKIFSPTFIGPVECSNVLIEGVSLEHSMFWNIVPVYCDSVIIRGVSVYSVGVAMGDGMDIESSRNVLIEYCTLENGDDCFTLKCGRGIDGLRVNRPTENIVLRYNLVNGGHGGITCGSETSGMIRNVYGHDCLFCNASVGIRFKTRRPRGGGGENLYYNRIRMENCGTAISVDMLGANVYKGTISSDDPQPVNEFTPTYHDIDIRNLEIVGSKTFLKGTGIPESPGRDIVIDNVNAQAMEFGKLIHMDGLKLSNAKLQLMSPAMSVTDTKNFQWEEVTVTVMGK